MKSALSFLEDIINNYQKEHKNPPKRVWVSQEMFETYESELVPQERWVDPNIPCQNLILDYSPSVVESGIPICFTKELKDKDFIVEQGKENGKTQKET